MHRQVDMIKEGEDRVQVCLVCVNDGWSVDKFIELIVLTGEDIGGPHVTTTRGLLLPTRLFTSRRLESLRVTDKCKGDFSY